MRILSLLPTAKIPLAALAVLVAVSGCRTTPTIPDSPDDGVYAGIPAVAASEPMAEAQPIIPTGNDTLDEFLSEIAAAIDRKDWRGVAKMMEPEAFAEQQAFLAAEGRTQPAAQIIAETLGIGELEGWDGLGEIRVITLREHTVQTPGIAGGEGFDLIDGTVRLENGRTLPIQFSIVSRGGVPVVLVPRG